MPAPASGFGMEDLLSRLRARIAIGGLKALEIRQRNKKIQSKKQGQA
jgi:hypothetical protein